MSASPDFARFIVTVKPPDKRDDPTYYSHGVMIEDVDDPTKHRIWTVFHAVGVEEVIAERHNEEKGVQEEKIAFKRLGKTDIAFSEQREGKGLPSGKFPKPGEEVAIVTFSGAEKKPQKRSSRTTPHIDTVRRYGFETILPIIKVNDDQEPTHPGMSGGPVIDTSGNVVAVLRGYPLENSSGREATVEPIGNILHVVKSQRASEILHNPEKYSF